MTWYKKVIREIHKYFLDVKAFTLFLLGKDFEYFFFDDEDDKEGSV